MFCQIVIYSLYLSSMVFAQYTPSPRWGQAVALLENMLYVHGGLCDPYNSYSYNSAPQISDLLVLDLSVSFNSSSPPWQLFHVDSSPALAWHTLSAFSATELLLFGGQPDPNSLTVLTTLNDSSGLLSTSSKSGPSLLLQPQNWGNEPMRRIRHSAPYATGKVWLIGGEMVDGSGNAFSDHYSFNPSSLEFVQLPRSPGAPPDIYGHASLVLPDGHLLVFGGYCASCSDLVPMNTIWSLDTARNSPVWEKLSISKQSLPSPRRDFASVVLRNGQVLIHGGGDAQLQTTYSDGWILDTSQNPMVWTSVAVLAQLGQRKDHFAVQAGGYVFFGFGYGSSAPAPASLFIYNSMTSSMVSYYSAPSPGSWPAVTSIPPPTKTGSDHNSEGGSGTTAGDSSITASHISGASSGSNTPTIAIVLGTTCGFLGLVAGGLATIYYVRRARNCDRWMPQRFSPLGDDPEFSPTEGLMDGAVPEAAHFEDQMSESATGFWISNFFAYLGISKPRSVAHHLRKDMFIDEDRSLRCAGHMQGQDNERASVWSLRSVGALIHGAMGSGPGESQAGVDQRDHEWEKIGHHLREGDGDWEGSIRPGSPHSNYASHPAHQNDGTYTDPFEDPKPDDHHDNLNLPPSVPEKDTDYKHAVLRSDEADDSRWSTSGDQDTAWPFSVRSHTLTPLREVSHISLTDLSHSLPSVQESPHGQMTHSNADNPAISPQASIPSSPSSPTTLRSSDPYRVTSISRHSILSSSTLSQSHSISRPDSWWSRLTKPPLLDRRASITTSKPLDFRDPSPAPPLLTFEESKESSPTPQSNGTPDGHGKSLSSAYSGRTANTDSAEHLGRRYDVVQRLASDGSSSRRAPSLGSMEVTEQGMFAINKPASTASSLPHVDPPRSTLMPVDPAMSLGTPIEALIAPIPNVASLKKGVVSSRVTASERRLSQELESQQMSAIRNTRRREEIPSRSRPSIQYGVAPHPSLFIANPELGHIS